MSDLKKVEDTIQELESLIESSPVFILGQGKVVVNSDKLNYLLENVRLSLPDELELSKKIVEDRKQIVASAEAEAKNIIAQARARASKLVESSEIVRASNDASKQIKSKTIEQNNEMMKATNDFLDSRLGEMEQLLTRYNEEVKSARQALKKRR